MLAERLFWSAYLGRHLPGQARTAWRPLAAIRRDQARRVRRMVAYACRHVPYYRETMDRLGLLPSDFRTGEDLARLPVLERQQVQREPERFASAAEPLGRCLRLRTGGSSGAPIEVCHDLRALFQSAAHTERERAMILPLIGKRFGYREALIVPPICSTVEVQRFCHQRAWFPPSVRIHRRVLSLLDSPEKNLGLLNEFKPDVVFSYGSYLASMFAHLSATGAPFHRPKAVTYTSDGLPDPARRLITKGFGIPVFGWYRAIEAFNIGQECERHLGLHLNADLYPVRIVDAEGRTLPPGESGDVVVSNLVNRATVLLNYRLGDIAALLPDACPCGRSLPLLSFPPGRSDDLITLPSGRTIHPQAVRILLSQGEPVWEYQVVQQTPTHFRVAVVAVETCDRKQLRERVVRKFAHTFGGEVTADVSFVESIDRTAAGKHRPVVSLVQRAPGCLP